MALLTLVTGIDNPILRKKSVPIKKITKKIKKLVADMTETATKVNALGIAAPQVGENLRIYIARLNHETKNEVWIPMINPEFLHVGEERDVFEEGCLSIPGKFGNMKRAVHVTITFLDEKGKRHILALEELNARIMQHEMDHLNGMLIADHWTSMRNRSERNR